MERRVGLGQLLAGNYEPVVDIFDVAFLTRDPRPDALGVLDLVPDDEFLRDIKRGIITHLLNLTRDRLNLGVSCGVGAEDEEDSDCDRHKG